MKLPDLLHDKHQFRLLLCGHKALEAGAACLLLMVQGQLGNVTLDHVAIATQTGLLAIVPAVWITFTQYARHYTNRLTSSAFLGACTFLADAAVHPSHFAGRYTEAALTGIGATLFSLAISFTPIGKRIDSLAESLLVHHQP
jgi:hypothetical protein